MLGATNEYARAVHGLTTRVKPEALRENTSPACWAADCIASCAGCFASIRNFLLSYSLVLFYVLHDNVRKRTGSAIRQPPFPGYPDSLKSGSFPLDDELELVGQVVFGRI